MEVLVEENGLEPSGVGFVDPADTASPPLALSSRSYFTNVPKTLIPPHSREAEFGAWDCKVTPAGCACQERNPTGCIPSNDGLDAGFEAGFSTWRKTTW